MGEREKKTPSTRNRWADVSIIEKHNEAEWRASIDAQSDELDTIDAYRQHLVDASRDWKAGVIESSYIFINKPHRLLLATANKSPLECRLFHSVRLRTKASDLNTQEYLKSTKKLFYLKAKQASWSLERIQAKRRFPQSVQLVKNKLRGFTRS